MLSYYWPGLRANNSNLGNSQSRVVMHYCFFTPFGKKGEKGGTSPGTSMVLYHYNCYNCYCINIPKHNHS